MPSETELRLYRDSLSTPWGFRLHGGKDLNAPLTVQRVSPGTPSDGELLAGDVILQIQGTEASRFTHLQAQDQVRKAGGSLLLRILRYGAVPRAPLPLVPTYASQQAPTSLKKPGVQEYGVNYARQSARIPVPVAVNQQPQPGFMLSRVKDTLSGVSGGSGGYPQYQAYETEARHSPSLYQPPSYTAPPAPLAPESPAWAGSLRSSGHALDSDKSIGPYPHSPKVQTVHYGPGGGQEYRQHAPKAGHDTDTVRAAHLQYNSPLGLYSKVSAQEALHTQLHGKPGEGTIKILSDSEAARSGGGDIGQSDF